MKCNSCGEEFNSCTSCDSCVSNFEDKVNKIIDFFASDDDLINIYYELEDYIDSKVNDKLEEKKQKESELEQQDGMFITAEEYKQLKNTERFIELIFG